MPASEDKAWKDKYETIQLENTILKANLETAQADIDYLKSTLRELESDPNAQKTEDYVLKADYDAMQTSYNALRADYTSIKASNDLLKDDYDTLKSLYDDVSNELAEIKKSSPVTPTPAPTPSTDTEQVFEDLAYIKAFIMPYSDDADPEYEGISIRVSYYNSKSELIYFTGVPVNVTVELYWYTNFPLIYRKQVIMDSNASFSKLGEEVLSIPDLEELLRIPFNGIEGKPSGMTRGPILMLTVSTPNQGNFTIQETISGFLWP